MVNTAIPSVARPGSVVAIMQAILLRVQRKARTGLLLLAVLVALGGLHADCMQVLCRAFLSDWNTDCFVPCRGTT